MPAGESHDGAYKLLFSHPLMVRELLEGFVREDWVRRLDFATLERVNGHYVDDRLRQRADDIVWRVRMPMAAAGCISTCCWSSRAAATRGWRCA